MKKVLAGGTFSIIHPGHIFFLREAKKCGDFLTVVVASDSTVRKNKGYVLFPAKERKRMVESIGFVDRVVIGDEKDMFRVVEKERPDVVVLGFDQRIDTRKLKERSGRKGNKIKIVRIRRFKNYSTGEIIGKIK